MNRAEMYHNLTTAELKEKRESLKQELFNLRFQNSTNQLKDPVQIRIVKKDIARIATILKERELNIPKNTGKVKKEGKK